MKINTIALVIILSSTVANVQSTKQCIICKNGTATPNLMPRADIGDTTTCKQIIESATMFDTDSDMCQALKSVEDVCCPSTKPCTFCVDQVVTDEDTSETGCGEMIELATLFELESEVCDEMKKAEMTCCPKAEDEQLDEEDKLFEQEDTSVGSPDSQPSVPLVNPIVSEIQSSDPSSSSSMSSLLVASSAVMVVFVLMM